jgi:hypothetical protein
MKLKVVGSLSIATLMMFVSGCSTVRKSHTYSPVGISIESEMTADVDVDLNKKLVGKSSATYLLGLFRVSGDNTYADGYGSPTRIGMVKSSAAYDAISKGSGDVLVSPQYVVKSRNAILFATFDVEVSGYDGKITSITKKPETQTITVK